MSAKGEMAQRAYSTRIVHDTFMGSVHWPVPSIGWGLEKPGLDGACDSAAMALAVRESRP
ncbi:MAG: hypothetical protein LKF99_07130 [Bifidobacterium sp.]|nr:hypothetical protein [Bifidobacterium sp.]